MALNVIWDGIRVFLPKVITKIVGKISVRNRWEDRNQDQDHNDIRILLHFVGNCRCISTALSWIFSLMNVLLMNLKIFVVVIIDIHLCIFMMEIVSYLPCVRLLWYQWYSEPLKTIYCNLLFDTLWSIYSLVTFHGVICYEKDPLLNFMRKFGYKFQQKISSINLI